MDTDTPEEATVSPRTRVWVAIDIAAEGPDAMTFVRVLLDESDKVIEWRVINPASEADQAEFKKVGDDLIRTFEIEGPMEPMFDEAGEPSGSATS